MRPLLPALCALVAGSLVSCAAATTEPPRAVAEAVIVAPAAPAPPAPPASAALPTAPPPAPEEPAPIPPEPAPAPFVAAPLPAALFDLRKDAEALFPERAKLIGTDALSLAPNPSTSGPYGSMLWPVPVIEARDPVYRILCITRQLRMALFAPADALSTLARRPTRLTASATLDSAAPPKDAVLLAPGARVDVLEGATGARVLVRHRGLFLETESYADRNDLGKTFTPGKLPSDPVWNGELIANVRVLDAPGGAVLATIAKQPPVNNRLLVHILSKAEGGFRRIRYEETDAYVVGWVPTESLKDLPTAKWGAGIGGSGYGTGGTRNPIRLAAGTRLRDPASPSGEPLGVLLVDEEHECTADCAGATPKVRLHGCGTSFEVVADHAALGP